MMNARVTDSTMTYLVELGGVVRKLESRFNMTAAEGTAPVQRLSPKLVSFDVFGTLINVRESSYVAFQSILDDVGGRNVDVNVFWEYWEHRNIAHYWEPYRRYRDICALSLADAFAHFRLHGEPALIERYLDAFPGFALFPDVLPALERLSQTRRIAIVSNIDDDLLALTPLKHRFDLVCTAERANGYKPDGTLFRYLIANAGVAREEILHSGQSQFTDMVGAKPLGLTVAWINRRHVALDPSVPEPDIILPDVASLVQLLA
jgi:2-haloacid dehalogenase